MHSPKKSIVKSSLQLEIPITTIQNMLHKHLRLHAYKVQLPHEIKSMDVPSSVKFIMMTVI